MGLATNTLSRLYTTSIKNSSNSLNFKRKAVQNQLWPNNTTIALGRTVLFSGTVTAVSGIWIKQFTPCKGFGGNYNYTYSISPALPSGITINSRTGVISGMSSVITNNTTYTVTVTSGGSTVTSTFILAVTSLFTIDAQVLIVGGGGGGATNENNWCGAGGGGGGGYHYETVTLSFPDNTQASGYLMTVGAGGTTGSGGTGFSGYRGGTSSMYKLNNLNISRAGGGGGVWYSLTEKDGASGGGSGSAQFGWWGTSAGPNAIGYGIYPGSPYIDAPRQGYNGGNGAAYSNWCGAGGGGGAGGIGVNYDSGGQGGPGLTCTDANITAATGTGVTNAYSGGGGGGNSDGNGYGGGNAGGIGGGGASNNGTANITLGAAYSGGGGGGGSSNFRGIGAGGSGGSGVIIVSYVGGQVLNGGTVYTYSGRTYHVFTTSGQYLTR